MLTVIIHCIIMLVLTPFLDVLILVIMSTVHVELSLRFEVAGYNVN